MLAMSVSVAQSELGPDAIVKNLYQSQNAGSGPFFQTKSLALVDRYFVKDLAKSIWKDYVDAKGDIGALDFDPLYGSQDPQISDFKIVESKQAANNKSQMKDTVVQVTFKDSGKKQRVSFSLVQDAAGDWKISDIRYPDKTSLRQVFSR